MKNENVSISSNDKLALISNFSTMLSAGIPILETVDSLLEDAKGNTKKILEVLREDLIEGKHLYSSFSRFPGAFDKVTINIIKAAEEAGTLDVTLKDLKQQITKDIEFRDKIKAALTYPLLIVIVFLGVFLLILLVVIPKISAVFLRLKVELPLPTKILIFVSNMVINYTIPVVITIVALSLGFILLYRKKKRWILNILFSLPFVENLAKEIDLTHFSRNLYLLLNAGITINNALELTEDVVTKPEITRAIIHTRETVLAGKQVSEGFKDNKNIFSAIMIRIIEAGERTGTLDKSMQEISEHLDYQVSNSLKTLTTILEPLMLVAIGILVGGMMLAIIAPIYGLIGQVGGR